MVDVVRNFAFPNDDAALQKQASVLASAFLASHAKELATRASAPSKELASFFASVCAEKAGGVPAWAPELGRVRMLIGRGNDEAAVCQLGLLLSRLGLVDQWSVEVSRPTACLIGTTVVTLEGSVDVSSSPCDLTIKRVSDAINVVLKRPDAKSAGLENDIENVAKSCGARLPADIATHGYVLCLERAPVQEVDGFAPHSDIVDYVERATPDFVGYVAGQVTAAYEIIDACAPEFSCYGRLLSRGVGAIPSDGFNTYAGSSPDFLGLIFTTFPTDVEWLAEVVVHESSHQFMNLLHPILPLTLPDDGARYYSSIKKMDRSLYRQINGYHAVVNIILFRRKLNSHYGDSPMRVVALERYETYAKEMRVELDRATAFTDAGRTFFGELNSRLDAL